jgi:tryptophan-rich sensory protein
MPAAVPAWLVIAAVVFAVALLLNPSRQEWSWFLRLQRPRWLSFERFIPLIWTAIYACFYASALLSWNAGGGWPLMAAYLLLLLLVQSYTLVICRTRRLASGTALGFAGWLWGMAVTAIVAPLSGRAALLLVPFLLWSPVGTFVTWRMDKLNR